MLRSRLCFRYIIFIIVHRVYLSLGANLGDRRANMNMAVELIDEYVGKIVRRSSMIETEPWGFDSDNKFLNMCVALDTQLLPHQLLRVTQDIERRLGRKSKSVDGVYSDRLIDIDILLYDDLRIRTSYLTIPHPHMRSRDFVMRPLMEIMDGDF